MEKLVAAISAGKYFGPVHDGRTLPSDPFSPDAPSISANIPMILGNTHDETRLLIGSSNPALFSLTWEATPRGARALSSVPRHPQDRRHHRRLPQVVPRLLATDVFFAVTTAFRSWHGMVIESERRAAQQGPTWVYNFAWKSPVDGGKMGRATHYGHPLHVRQRRDRRAYDRRRP